MAIVATQFTDLLTELQTTAPAATVHDLAAILLELMIAPPDTVDISNVNFFNNPTQAYGVESFSITGTPIALTGGLFFSSGDLPDDVNNEAGHSTGFGGLGDADLSAVATAAFSGAGVTVDAVGLEFTITVNDPAITGISFDLVFGSEEFPEYSDSDYVDVAAVFVNGVNAALFDNDPLTPLSVIDRNLVNNNFIDNTGSLFGTEYDGFSNILTVRVSLNQGVNTIKIAVADTGDAILDSGLYVTNAELLTGGGGGGGTLVVVDGSDDDDVLEGTSSGEEFNLGEGGDIVCGELEQLDGDVIVGFGFDDKLLVKNSVLSLPDFTVTGGEGGAIIVEVDGDGDGNPDAAFTFAGNYDSAQFALVIEDGSTFFTLVEDGGGGGGGGGDGDINGDPDDRNVLNGNDGANVINGGTLQDIIDGGDGDDVINGGNGENFLRGGEGDDTANGGADDDNLYGEGGNDKLYGFGGADRLDGGIGDDELSGGTGKDRLYGGDGADELDGGDGNDVLGLSQGISKFGDGDLDKVFFDNNDGADKVYGFEVGLDEVHLTSGSGYSLAVKSGNTILTYGTTSVTFYDVLLTNGDIVVA